MNDVFSRLTLVLYYPRSLVAGILWMVYDGQFNLRHTCEHGDHLQRYGWIRHDGTTFGQQEIFDNGERRWVGGWMG